MKVTHAAIARGLAKHADHQLSKTAAFRKVAVRRWLEDSDLIKLCKLFQKHSRKSNK